MTREINFENQIPSGILDTLNRMKKMGASAHKGLSGHYYKIGDAVRRGEMIMDYGPGSDNTGGRIEEHGMTQPRHTHRPANRLKDGVYVFTEPTTDMDESGKIVH